MKKDIFGILGVAITVIGFSIYYPYAYCHYIEVTKSFDLSFKPIYGTLNYIPLMFGMSLFLIQLMKDSVSHAKFIVYGSGAVLWASIAISYVFKDVLHLISTKIFIISIAILCTISGLALYAYRSRFK